MTQTLSSDIKKLAVKLNHIHGHPGNGVKNSTVKVEFLIKIVYKI
jgi:hypothetical protein